MDVANIESTWNEGGYLYRIAGDLLGYHVLRIGEFPLELCLQARKRAILHGPFKEFYWTIRSVHRPKPQLKWRYNNHGNNLTSKPVDLLNIFDYSDRNPHRAAAIQFKVRNWKQRPMQILKRKAPVVPLPAISNFAYLSNTKLRPFSKCYIVQTKLLPSTSLECVL